MKFTTKSLVSNYGFTPDQRLVDVVTDEEHQPIRVEVVPNRDGYVDELSGDHYNNRALFYNDGSVEIVSYKGESEGSFDTEQEYREWLEMRDIEVEDENFSLAWDMYNDDWE